MSVYLSVLVCVCVYVCVSSIMTYDLDDGYDGIGSSWCIGELAGNHYTRSFVDTDYKKEISIQNL